MCYTPYRVVFNDLFVLFFAFLALPVWAQAQALEQPAVLAQSPAWFFEENKGQVKGADALSVRYFYQSGNFSMFLLPTGIAYQFHRRHYPEGYAPLSKFSTAEEERKEAELAKKIRLESYRMDVELVGANARARISTAGKSSDFVQYYNHAALDVHSYSRVTYHDIYPNIDWVLYYTPSGELKYDFVVRAGGDARQIQLKTRWVEGIELNADGGLTLKNRMGSISEKAPISLQNGREIATRFVQEGGVLRFDLGDYDKGQTLVIDPNVVWATYYGGSSTDQFYSCETDLLGNVYGAGYTSSTTFIASGGHQNSFGGGLNDAFLVKFNSNGARQWATYYGGSNGDVAYSCAVDHSGNVFMTGRTESNSGIASSGHQGFHGGSYDAFLVKFDAQGTRLWATYYGDTGDDRGLSCKIDTSGYVYMVGYTGSQNNIASSSSVYGGGTYDGFIAKFNVNGVRVWARYYGNTLDDRIYACAIDVFGNIYVSGTTNSTTGMTMAAHQSALGGGYDAFLAKFNSGSDRQWSTYYGGTGDDYGYICALNSQNIPHLGGTTTSSSGIASGGHQNTFGGGSDGFLAQFSVNGTRHWGTYYGGTDGDSGEGGSIDNAGNIYLTGLTASTTNIAFNGHQNSYAGTWYDAYLVKFNNAGVRQWATYYGDTPNDGGYACAADNAGFVYLAGYAESGNLAAGSVHQNSNHGAGDGFLVKFRATACAPSAATVTQSSCTSFTLHQQTYSASGTYSQTITNASGCDSVITLNLTIDSLPDTTIVENNGILSATAAATAYQWLDCDNGNSPIAGATNASFSPSRSGNYAVSISNGSCSALSACQNFLHIGIAAPAANSADFKVYPNPTHTQTFFLETPSDYSGNLRIQLYDALGRSLWTKELPQNSPTHQIELPAANSVYMLRLHGDNGFVQTWRIVATK